MAGVMVLYDEGCAFCAGVARRLDRRDAVTTAAIGSAAGSLLLRDLSPAERYASLHVIDGLGRRFSAGAGLARLLRELPGGRPLAAFAEAVPGLTEHAYRLVARNRGAASRLFRVRGGRPQSTDSKSTTNTSGSCGAITPPAPRAP